MQAPYGLDACLPDERCRITLECNGEAWEVIWLPRPSGAGLSGGWRGFAIDQRIALGDAVVFEKMPGLRVKVKIFRAWQYMEGEHAAAEHAFTHAEGQGANFLVCLPALFYLCYLHYLCDLQMRVSDSYEC